MKPILPINKDEDPFDVKDGSTLECVNMATERRGSRSNERGFDISLEGFLQEDQKAVGFIEHTDGVVVLFSLYFSGVSEIGRLKYVNGEVIYEVICKDSVGNLVLNFDINYAVTGIVSKTLGNNYICLFRSETITPKILDLDNLPFEVSVDKTIVSNGDLVNLFPSLDVPVTNVTKLNNTGGSLHTGTYFLAYSYQFIDLQETSYIGHSLPMYVTSDFDTLSFVDLKGNDTSKSTNKSINVNLTNVDQKFKKLNVYFIVIKDGITSSFFWRTLPITGASLDFIFDGTESEAVDFTSLITPNATFIRAHTTDQLDRRAYVANTEERQENYQFQHIANSIETNWTPYSVGLNSLPTSHKSFIATLYDKTFLPDEVYALYIEYLLDDGSSSKLYHIPGRDIILGEDAREVVDTPNELALGGDVRKYQTRNYALSSGELSFYENKTEVYPDIEGYNDDPNGSLAGQKVRHHKMPSIKKLKEFGENVMDNDTEITSGSCKLRLTAQDENNNQNKAKVIYPTSWNNSAASPFSLGAFTGSVIPEESIPASNLSTVTMSKDMLIRIEYCVLFATQIDGDSTPNVDSIKGRVKLYIDRVDGVTRDDISSIEETSTEEFGNSIIATMQDRKSITVEVKEGDKLSWFADSKIQTSGSGSPDDLYGHITLCLELHSIYATKEGSDIPTLESTGVGIELSNIVIPPNLTDTIKGYRIHVAKRSYSNSTILDSSIKTVDNGFKYYFPQPSHSDPIRNVHSIMERSYGYNPYGEDSFPVSLAHSTVQPNTQLEAYSPAALLKDKPAITPSYLDVEAMYDVASNTYKTTVGDPNLSGVTVYPIESFEYVDNNYLEIDNNRIQGESAHIVLDTLTFLSGSESTTPYVNFKVIKDNIYSILALQDTFVVSKVHLTGDTSTDKLGGDAFVSVGLSPCTQTYYNDHSSKAHLFTNALYKTIYSSYVDLNSVYPLIYSSVNLGYREDILNISDESPTSELKPDLSLTYNKDFSAVNDYIVSSIYSENSLNDSYKHPYRVHRSVAIGNEEPELKWRTFKPLDYYEMPSDKGVVWNIQAYNNNLIIHLTDALFVTRGNEELKVAGESVAIGTSDIFERKPTEYFPSRDGHIGTFSQIGAIMTTYGYFFIDEKRGKVYLLSLQSKEPLKVLISGLNYFFRDNLAISSNINIDATSFENTDVYDNPHNTKGFSVIFDDYYDRFLISKIDDNNSWTLSYGMSEGGYISFHSYSANMLFNIVYKNYSINKAYRNLYAHSSKLLKGTYYDQSISSDSYVDVIFNIDTPVSKIFSSIYWNSDVEELNSARNNRKTVSRIFLYNSYQASAEISVDRLKNARKTGGKWACNSFRDILTKEARDAEEPFMVGGILNPNLIDPNKAWYKKIRFRDNYIVVRFIFDNTNNELLFLHEVDAEIRKEIR